MLLPLEKGPILFKESSMSAKIVNGVTIPNLLWEERPAGSSDVVWRYSQNPVIPRNLIPTSNSIFNSAVIPYQGAYVGVFRIDDTRRVMNIYYGHSQDGLKWEINPNPIEWVCDD